MKRIYFFKKRFFKWKGFLLFFSLAKEMKWKENYFYQPVTQVYPDYFKACVMVQESEQRDWLAPFELLDVETKCAFFTQLTFLPPLAHSEVIFKCPIFARRTLFEGWIRFMLHNGTLCYKVAGKKSISFPKVKVAWCVIHWSNRLRVKLLL